MSEHTTPFIENHRAAGARLVSFAGFLMPIQYQGITAEHATVRHDVGLFDVSHMGEFVIRGSGAIEFGDRLVTNAVADAEPGQVLYSPMCTPQAGIIDDVLVYRYADHLMLVVNAANIDADWEHVRSLAPGNVTLENRSSEIAQLALQGPKAKQLLQSMVDADVLELSYYRFQDTTVLDVPTLVSRTGYTGEDGFELYFPGEHANRFWRHLHEKGESFSLRPCGLGARDLLRLEMGFCLYGNDIDRTTNPLEAGLGWTVKMKKPDFIGKPALQEIKTAGLERRLVGFEVEGRRIARHGMDVIQDGEKIGIVTSGTYSPSLSKGIGMAYVPDERRQEGSRFGVSTGRTELDVRVVSRPIYHGAFHSRKRVTKTSGG